MNWITQLKKEKNDIHEKNLNARVEILNFRGHLLSPKFHADTTIQVQDVQNWLDNIQNKLTEL